MTTKKKRTALTVPEIALFAMLGALMFASKILMEALPNIHLLGVFTMAFTVALGKKALYPIYIYVFIQGLYGGFNLWWVPYLYLWTILWGATMLLPKHLPKKYQGLLYMGVCALHGFLYGILYAPAEALLFGLNFEGMVAWIVSGIPYDLLHGFSNFLLATAVLPLSEIIKKMTKTK